MSADDFLGLLDKVKNTGQGRWIACCPAHDDRSPSLSIRALDDGRVLVHCFAGCDVGSVLEAVIQSARTPQTTKNKICQGTFPVRIVKIGNRKMVRVQDLLKCVDELPGAEVARKRGAPTKQERLARKVGQQQEGSK